MWQDAKELQRVSRLKDQLGSQVAQLQAQVEQHRDWTQEVQGLRAELETRDSQLVSEREQLQGLLAGWPCGSGLPLLPSCTMSCAKYQLLRAGNTLLVSLLRHRSGCRHRRGGSESHPALGKPARSCLNAGRAGRAGTGAASNDCSPLCHAKPGLEESITMGGCACAGASTAGLRNRGGAPRSTGDP